MEDIFSLSNIEKYFTGEQLLEGLFGIEWEGLRTLKNGLLRKRRNQSRNSYGCNHKSI